MAEPRQRTAKRALFKALQCVLFTCIRVIHHTLPIVRPAFVMFAVTLISGERGNREGQGEAGGSQGILGEGPGVVDLQRCWGCDEQSYQG